MSECVDARLEWPEYGGLPRFMMGKNKLNNFPAFPGIKSKSNNLGALLRSVACMLRPLLDLTRSIPSQKEI